VCICVLVYSRQNIFVKFNAMHKFGSSPIGCEDFSTPEGITNGVSVYIGSSPIGYDNFVQLQKGQDKAKLNWYDKKMVGYSHIMFCKTLETHTESHMGCHWDLPAPLESRTNRAAAYFFASCMFLSSLGGLSSLQFTKQLCWGYQLAAHVSLVPYASLCNSMNTYWITRNCNLLCKWELWS
jgi:hypothetical protein